MSQKEDWIDILKNCMTEQQLTQMAEVISQTRALAIQRRSDQLFQIPFNDKGYPIGFNGSNWVRAIRPPEYQSDRQRNGTHSS